MQGNFRFEVNAVLHVFHGKLNTVSHLSIKDVHHCFITKRDHRVTNPCAPKKTSPCKLSMRATMREQLTFRREARRKQLRFRKDPAAYLAALEEILLKTGLPS